MAESCLENLINSVEDGTVAVATLKLLRKHSKQYSKLCELYQKNQSSHRSGQMLTKRLSELDAFFTVKDKLEYFISLISIFTTGTSDFLSYSLQIFKE